MAIVLGVLLGVLACLVLVAVLLLLAARRRKRAREEDSEAAESASGSQVWCLVPIKVHNAGIKRTFLDVFLAGQQCGIIMMAKICWL